MKLGILEQSLHPVDPTLLSLRFGRPLYIFFYCYWAIWDLRSGIKPQSSVRRNQHFCTLLLFNAFYIRQDLADVERTVNIPISSILFLFSAMRCRRCSSYSTSAILSMLWPRC